MLCPRCKRRCKKLFEVKDVIVFGETSTTTKNLARVKPRKCRRENPKAKPKALPLEEPNPRVKLKTTWLPYVALYYCPECLTFYKRGTASTVR